MRYVVVLVAGAATIASCTSVHTFERDPSLDLAKVKADSVAVYPATESLPCDSIQPVADLEGEGDLFTTKEGMIEHFQREAGNVGANAVILEGYSQAGLIGNPDTSFKVGRATAVRTKCS